MQTTEKKANALAACAVASLLSAGALIIIAPATAAELEKCAGIAAAGKNDCGTPVSSCAGSAKQDRDPHAWVLVPKGTCAKITGGSVATDAMNKRGGGVSR